MRLLVVLFFCLSSLLFASEVKIVEDKCDLTILTPSLQGRKSLKLRLENGLEAFLVSDPGATDSGAALSVHVGSFHDPVGYPGLAHFVEHMLFMGTETFPDEKEYHRFLDEHGGTNNAFTCPDRTVYMFAINHAAFEGGLTRFSEFFISPLFQPSCLQRECQAVDQEFSKNIPLDSWRTQHVHKELANEKHPFHTFCIGNRSTLGHVTRDEVVQWYESHYSAHLMHLFVYSPLPLEKLQEIVTERFNKIKNRPVNVEIAKTPIYTKSAQQKLIVIEPSQKIQKLDLSWEIPSPIAKDRDVRADRYLSYLLGHEGEKSLVDLLKKEGLCESVGADTQHLIDGHALFTLSCSLTSQGVKNYERVIELVFEAIRLYSKTKVPAYLFDEMVQMQKIAYAYQQREDVFDYVTEMGYAMPDEPLETFPKLTLIPGKFDPTQVETLLHTLKPENCTYTLIAPKDLTDIKLDRKEKWMGVNYALVDIDAKKISSWASLPLKSALSLPKRNSFIPDNLKLVQENIALKTAQEAILPPVATLYDDAEKKVYYSSDDRFFVPEVFWSFSFKTPAISDDQLGSKVLADLYCHAIKKKLNSLCYEAELAGLGYSLDATHNGLNLKINGYSEKAKILLITILEAFSHQPNPAEFALYKEELERKYRNAATKTAVIEGYELLLSILYKDYAGNSHKQDVISKISYEQFITFSSQLFESSFLEATLFGNITETESKEVIAAIEKKISFKNYPPEKQFKVELAHFPESGNPLFLVKKSKLPSNALILTLDCNPFSTKNQAALNVLSKALEEPFFSELRTRQQTAYLVTNFAQEKEEHLYLFFLIQSSTHDPRDLLSRFELFFESSLQNFSEAILSAERFENIRSSLIANLEHTAENLGATGASLDRLGFEYEGDFAHISEEIAALKSLTYDELKEFAQEVLGVQNHRRLAVLVNGAVDEKILNYRRIPNVKTVRKSISYDFKN